MADRLAAGPNGVLPRQCIVQMTKDRYVSSVFTIEDRQYQPASLDLRLGEKVYRVQCSFLPGKDDVQAKLARYTVHSWDLTPQGVVLEPGAVYVVPLMEALRLPGGLRAKANPRSTTGRLDIFTRVITDRNDRFDEIAEGYTGPLYLEIVSRSFPVKVGRGMALSQIRFVRGAPRCTDDEIEALNKREGGLLYESNGALGFAQIVLREGLYLGVDLTGTDDTRVVGYRARRNSGLIDLGRLNHYNILDYWDPVFGNDKGHLILEKGEFYLLTSKERVRIPPDHAAEMVAYEQPSGELRTHYAGFFDPGFGYGAEGEVKGTVAVMEVRALDAPFMVEDGQKFCKLQLERMAAPPNIVYGVKEIGSSYQHQTLTPSKHFRPPDAKEIRKRMHVIEQMRSARQLVLPNVSAS
jgi:dCTP deaminase